jgi:hypothetical protein
VRRDAERLTDIIEAADKIATRVGRGREAFDKDEDVQIAIVHLIQVIGEAASGLSDDLVDAHPEVPWRQIVADLVMETIVNSCPTTPSRSPSVPSQSSLSVRATQPTRMGSDGRHELRASPHRDAGLPGELGQPRSAVRVPGHAPI